MPIEMYHHQRAHLGEPDTMYPRIICDHCHTEITNVKMANYLWKTGLALDGRFVVGKQVYFLHKGCTRQFEANNSGPARWMCEELRHFWRNCRPQTDLVPAVANNMQ